MTNNKYLNKIRLRKKNKLYKIKANYSQMICKNVKLIKNLMIITFWTVVNFKMISFHIWNNIFLNL